MSDHVANFDLNPCESTDLQRINWLKRSLDRDPHKATHLDVGCGSGLVCAALGDLGYQSVGVDIVDVSERAHNWKFIKADLQDEHWSNPLGVQFFNVVTAFDIIEHLDNPVLFLKNIRKVMNHNSRLFLTTPHTNSWERLFNPHSWSGARDPQHIILFNMYSLKFLMEKCGFKVVHLSAPIRKLSFLGRFCPNIGGQIYVVAELS